MNTSQLKSYAPRARRDFIAAVTARAALFGLTKKEIAPVTQQGDVAIIGGRAFPKEVAARRARLEGRIGSDGFDRVMEAMAYTWFNRLMAIRYMELHGYLEHGYRVLSHPEGKALPEILEHAAEVDLPGLDKDRVVELRLDGSRDEELYRLLLLAQCNALHQAMPFLFERIGDETELLLPPNLLHTDSLIRKMVEEIDEELWQEIEIIGWLYQFYISEKKDQVIGKKVKSEDIPAATQLFTPNWIVKYLVQNSLGAQWLAAYPDSPLKGQMEYYIEPAEQAPEVQAQLADIKPDALNPEELTLIDPACGSGHILVEAYDLFKAIYLERGYRKQDLPQLILEKNLFGLEICPRAAQLTGFALMMKGRANDLRLFERGVKLNVMALVDSAGFDAKELARTAKLGDYGLMAEDLTMLSRLFEHAATFGSLIKVPKGLKAKLPGLKQLSQTPSQGIFLGNQIRRLGPLVRQAEVLAGLYDAVVVNPPYIDLGNMNPRLKKFVESQYKETKQNLDACFVSAAIRSTAPGGESALITQRSWMFLSRLTRFRKRMLRETTLSTMLYLGPGAFPSVSGEKVQNTAFVVSKRAPMGQHRSVFFKLTGERGAAKEQAFLARRHCYITNTERLRVIPGHPLSFWASKEICDAFVHGRSLKSEAEIRVGLDTGDNSRFIRSWQEVDYGRIGFASTDESDFRETEALWAPHSKGGSFRKWFGNLEHVLRYSAPDVAVLEKQGNSLPSRMFYFREGYFYTRVSSDQFSVRLSPLGTIFNSASPTIFPNKNLRGTILAFLNSKVVDVILECLSPTLNYQAGELRKLPLSPTLSESRFSTSVGTLVRLATADWNAREYSWEFRSPHILMAAREPVPTLELSYTAWITQCRDGIEKMRLLEEENNRYFIDAYGLAKELTPEVPVEQITLTINPAYRYGGKLSKEEQWARFRQDTMKELVSYAIGCMMGRYSLDEPGLIYAHSGNEGFDPSRYSTFPADADGIVPITGAAWFNDNAAKRVVEFLSLAWDDAHLEENLAFLADNLSPRKNESSRDTLRRYLSDSFFKDHLQTYKKRPIYWLFSSGRQKAFQCLVYLHRYNEGTLGRMRTEYVVPLQGMMASRIQQLEGDIAEAASTSHRKRLERERDALVKQRVELQEFDEKLRHYADQRIALDLDDGVKVNYGKFGDLLAEVKKVTAKKPAAS